MTCDACDRAQTNVHTGRFNAGCLECAARALAGSPLFYEAAQVDGITTNYRLILQKTFGKEWKEGHARVKAWADRLHQAKETTP